MSLHKLAQDPMMKTRIEKPASPSPECQEDQERALEAARNGRADDLAHILRANPSLFGHLAPQLTWLATESLSEDTLNVLLKYGWDINEPESYSDPPPMGRALRLPNSRKVVLWFLEHGADPNAYASMYRTTPLSRAVQFAPLEIVQLLFERGGRAEQGDLVSYACQRSVGDKSTLPILQILLEKGAPVDNVLFESFPQLRDVSMFWGTPLWMCCAKGNTEAARLLLAHGADPQKEMSLAALSPFQVAQKNGHHAICSLLTDAMQMSHDASR